MDLRWHSADEDADACLAAHLHDLLGVGEVRSGRLCPRCGSDVHGRPWSRHRGRAVEVSLSRAGDHLLTAVGDGGPLGVDVESVAAVARHWDPRLVLAAGERADGPRERALAWVRKEAVAKARGVGLAEPLVDQRLAAFDGAVVDVPAPGGFVAAWAELRSAELRAAREGPSGTARRRTTR